MTTTVQVPPQEKVFFENRNKIHSLYTNDLLPFNLLKKFYFVLRSQPWKVNIRLGKSFVSSRKLAEKPSVS